MNAASKFVVLFAALALFAYLSDPKAQQITRQNFMPMIIQSLNAPSGVQDVTLGPMKDGQTIKLQLEYLNTGEGTRVTHRDGFPACITVDRLDVAKANLVVDAALICQSYGQCNQLRAYVENLWSVHSPQNLMLLEEIVPQLAPKLEGWVADSVFAQSWIANFHQFILGLQLHEIAHVSLHTNQSGSYSVEAEADGFALALATIVDLPVNGLNYLLVLRVDPERKYEAPLGNYPQAECRVEAFELGLTSWYGKYKQTTNPLAEYAASNRSAFSASVSGYLPNIPGMCERYVQHFHEGVLSAAELIDSQTKLDSVNREGDRCATFGGQPF